MKNSGEGGEGGKVIVKRSQTARPAYQLYLLQWETAAGSAFGAFPELNSTVAGSFRTARLQARVVTNEQNFTSIDMERFSRTEEFLPRPGTADPSLAVAVAECATAPFSFSLAFPLLFFVRSASRTAERPPALCDTDFGTRRVDFLVNVQPPVPRGSEEEESAQGPRCGGVVRMDPCEEGRATETRHAEAADSIAYRAPRGIRMQ
ncbi:uncharacterized protein LOC112552889 [Pogonomyrmex barbatus]|uniref:Uncharacterized protein LOC112552889 n=1 Tax=Pogonomyrmex barbatus TaxID=144034 RepID=A0A8N1SAL8_9HYME|nr:uncharacterized protein LOC112552889 [Pogonomyrmex barbatus]